MSCKYCDKKDICHPYVQHLQKSGWEKDHTLCQLGLDEILNISIVQEYLCKKHSVHCQTKRHLHNSGEHNAFVSRNLPKFGKRDLWSLLFKFVI